MIKKNIIIGYKGNHASIPSGFTRETDLDERFPKGTANATNPNSAGGAHYHSHTSPTHTHAMVAHGHAVTTGNNFNDSYQGSGSGSSACDVHSHSGTVNGLVGGGLSGTVTYGLVSNNPPFVELIWIKATRDTTIPVGGILFYSLSTTAPTGFSDSDGNNGTYDMRNKYPRGATTGANSGATGGSTQNLHSIDHSHPSVSHYHQDNLGGANGNTRDLGVGDGPSKAPSFHTHAVTLNSTSETPNSYTGTAGGAETVEPAYTKLRALQNTSSGNKHPKKGMIALFRGLLANIPKGWKLCDGSNGTIDMRQRYLKITNTAGEVGNTGGSNTHSHALGDSHNHTAPGTHTHTGSIARFTAITGGTQNQSVNAVREHDHTITSIGTATSSWVAAQTSADSANNEPAHATVAFIQFFFRTGGSWAYSFA